ncbi:hypothetical protein C8Q76DRAFT_272638 [Earliella scabrosa]|nr:hypothetical protein C8Q76DRAFT_272638 [Earliella scabrosa]
MLSHFKNIFSSTSARSVLLVVGNIGCTVHVLHVLPEDGSVERFSFTTPSSITTFRYRGAQEQSREQVGDVTLHVGDGETVTRFLGRHRDQGSQAVDRLHEQGAASSR